MAVLAAHPAHVLSPGVLFGAMVTMIVFWMLVERSANRSARKARAAQRHDRLSKPLRAHHAERPQDWRRRIRRWMDNDYVFIGSNVLLAAAAATLAYAGYTILGTAWTP